jgi:hypothetical protein
VSVSAGETLELDGSGLGEGIYFIQISSEDGAVANCKMVKN